jgi:hypothetical protein
VASGAGRFFNARAAVIVAGLNVPRTHAFNLDHGLTPAVIIALSNSGPSFPPAGAVFFDTATSCRWRQYWNSGSELTQLRGYV